MLSSSMAGKKTTVIFDINRDDGWGWRMLLSAVVVVDEGTHAVG